MKLIIATLLAVLSFSALANDFTVHADVYRDSPESAVERVGVSYGDFGFAGSYTNESERASIEWRRHASFTNIEIGIIPTLTYGTGDGLVDWRTIDIADNLFLEAKPYVKIGSDVFVLIMNDSTNQNTVRIGFKLF